MMWRTSDKGVHMSELNFERLESGEPAYTVGKVTYALISRNGVGAVYSLYNPNEKPVELLPQNRFSYDSNRGIDHAGFVEFVKVRIHHQKQTAQLGRYSESASTSTPWGQADTVTRYGRGINFYNTPSHGGIKLSAGLNKTMPAKLRSESGWYEEDSEMAKVIFGLPQFFTDYERGLAEDTMINNYPDEYEALTRKIIPDGVSMEKERIAFEIKHANDWVVTSAVNSKEFPGMVEVYATVGGRRSSHSGPAVEERQFLVPSDEYTTSKFGLGFVIDLDRHVERSIPAMKM